MNLEFQIKVLNYLENNLFVNDHKKSIDFINTNQFDKFEEICRFHREGLKPLGYNFTPGLASSYDEFGQVEIEQYICNNKRIWIEADNFI